MKTIALIRHGKTQGNLERRYIGATDEPLCTEGKAELLKKMESRAYPGCELLFSSPMKRCIQTASLIYPDQTPVLVDDLRECNFGDFEGKTYEELLPDERYRAFLDQGGNGEIPNGEAPSHQKDRCCAAFEQIVRMIKEKNVQNVSIVCHGGTIMSLLERFDIHQRSFYDYQVENCGGYLGTFDEFQNRFIRLERF